MQKNHYYLSKCELGLKPMNIDNMDLIVVLGHGDRESNIKKQICIIFDYLFFYNFHFNIYYFWRYTMIFIQINLKFDTVIY